MTKHKEKIYSCAIGVDFGEGNVGVALGRNKLVTPLKIIRNTSIDSVVHELIRIAFENKADAFVVGIPLTLEGKMTQKALNIRKFGKLLQVRSKKPVVYQNEFATTKDSIEEAINTGFGKKSRSLLDHLSATLILKMYFDTT